MSMAVHGTSHGANDLLSATKDMHGCFAILCPLKQYFSHAMIMDGWLKS